jgi:transcriptional regulator with XRE-family HTH domain
MPNFIYDLITARGWSIRHLAELTDISYSGIRDYLKGFPNRLSQNRLNRVYEILELNEKGGLKANTLYTWRVTAKEDQLSALNKVLQVTIEASSKAEVDAKSKTQAETPKPTADKFRAIPFLGGGIAELPAPYWVLRHNDIYILIQWALPKTNPVKKTPGFHTNQNIVSIDSSKINPDIGLISSVIWADKMTLSTEKVCGIQLSHTQLTLLQNTDSLDALELDTINKWILVEPTDDPHWQLFKNNKIHWTWELISQKLQNRYVNPEEAANALKLK